MTTTTTKKPTKLEITELRLKIVTLKLIQAKRELRRDHSPLFMPDMIGNLEKKLATWIHSQNRCRICAQFFNEEK